jgi:hypothetical protein
MRQARTFLLGFEFSKLLRDKGEALIDSKDARRRLSRHRRLMPPPFDRPARVVAEESRVAHSE